MNPPNEFRNLRRLVGPAAWLSSRSRTWPKANELTRCAQRISEKIKALKGIASD
jgi:hypothetical protein